MKNNIKRLLSRGPAFWIIAGAIFVAVLLIAGRERDAPVPRPERAWVVDVVTAERGKLRPTLELFGSVQSPQNAGLSPGVDGLIVEVPVRDGASVNAGEVLAIIDDRDVRLELQQQEADLLEIQAQTRLAKRRLVRARSAFEKEKELLALTESRSKRAQDLFEQGLLSTSDLETTDENLKRQQLAVSQAELSVEEIEIQLTELSARRMRAEALRDQSKIDLERTRLTAPFPGVVSELVVSEGDRVRSGDILMRLQNPAAIEIRTQIPARYAPVVTGGLASGIEMPALVESGEQRFAGSLVRISGQTSESSGGVDSFVGFEAAPASLRLGSTVRVLLDLPPEPDVIALPAEALYGRNRIYRTIDNRMQMVEVERVGERVSPDDATDVLVRSPRLADGDAIVVTKLSNAADGLLVRPDAEGAGEPPGKVAERN